MLTETMRVMKMLIGGYVGLTSLWVVFWKDGRKRTKKRRRKGEGDDVSNLLEAEMGASVMETLMKEGRRWGRRGQGA